MRDTIICIGRQYGSGGREVGQKLAQELGVPYYDKLLLQQAAQRQGIALHAVEQHDEKPVGLSSMGAGNLFADQAALTTAFYSQEQRVYEAQRQTILDLAGQGSCVIIGRCAASVLRSAGANCLSVFIYGDEDDKLERIARRNGIDRKAAARRRQKMDRMRRRYVDFYSDTPWGDPSSYDLMISTSHCGIQGAVQLIQKALEQEGGAAHE